MRRGEVWLVGFEPEAAAGEPARSRPALIVSTDRFNRTRASTVVVVPLTTTFRGHPLHVEIENSDLQDVSYAQPELVGVVSRSRLLHRLATLDDVQMLRVSLHLRQLLEL